MSLAFELTPLDSTASLPKYWDTLYAQDHQASPFVSSQWTDSWIRHYGKVVDIQLCTWKLQGEPVAVCLVVKRRGKWGIFRVSQIGINSSLDFVEGSACIEFNDIICLPANKESVRESLAEFANSLDADEVHVSGATQTGLLDQLVPQNTQFDVELDYRKAPFLDMSTATNATEIVNLFSANTRSQIRRTEKHFEKLGKLTVTIAENEFLAIQFFKEMTAMHQEYWTSRGEPGAFKSTHLFNFHQDLITNYFGQGIYRIFKIAIDDQALGYIYGFERFKRFYFYQSGVNYNFERNLKPGLLAHLKVMQALLELGFKEYDFLAGVSQYKRSISNKERTLHWKIFRKNSSKMRCLVQMAKLKRTFLS
jgi:Acetyltransferase (GNAT) domain